jgi:hypothetical protein
MDVTPWPVGRLKLPPRNWLQPGESNSARRVYGTCPVPTAATLLVVLMSGRLRVDTLDRYACRPRPSNPIGDVRGNPPRCAVWAATCRYSARRGRSWSTRCLSPSRHTRSCQQLFHPRDADDDAQRHTGQPQRHQRPVHVATYPHCTTRLVALSAQPCTRVANPGSRNDGTTMKSK